MKKTCFLLVFTMIVLSSFAQAKPPVFAYGIGSDFLSIPLSEKSLLSRSTNVYLSYCVNKNLNFKIGYDGLLLQETGQKSYDNQSGLMLGAGYMVLRDKAGFFSNEITFSVSNSFKEFISFKDYHADLGTRIWIIDAFYLGGGLRWNHNETTGIIVSPTNSLNVYLQLGLQFYIGKKLEFYKRD
ncbi:MAG: hypothetical protein PHQ11_01465 [Paludibacter sp.]|nr:hypothetical protein [Paludibacter sp.]MDD4198688.1 hypothetical protein [Paludibacter sp.]MDD4427106.1 hypothetical protein [Paludibacter sp.]